MLRPSTCHLIFCIFYFLFFISTTHAQTTNWKVIWDLNKETDITEYKVYRYTPNPQNVEDSLRAVVPHNVSTDSSEINLSDSTITFFDERLKPGILFTYQIKAVNESGLVSDFSESVGAAVPSLNIPDQAFETGQTTILIPLEVYTSDPDHKSDFLTWTYSGNEDLIVSISDSLATIRIPEAAWEGPEQIVFHVTDPDGFTDTDDVTFTRDANSPPTISADLMGKDMYLMDTVIVLTEGANHVCEHASWYSFVSDSNHTDEELQYQIRNGKHIKAVDSTDYCTLIPDLHFYGTDTLLLVVSDGIAADSAYFVAEVLITSLITEDDSDFIPSELMLFQNYPNPFNPSTTIRYALPRSGHVILAVYDILGRKIADLVNARQTVGHHQVVFDAADLPNGTYFCRLRCGSLQKISKMVLQK